MNRRTLLAAVGAGAGGFAGCAALKRTVLSDDDESSGGANESGNESSSTDADSTETPPEGREETDPETTTQENETEQSDEVNETETPSADPIDAVEIVEHEMIFDEAADPNYESDELYINAIIRNTTDRDLTNVRLDAYAYANEIPVGHEYIEYSALEADVEKEPEIQFYLDDPAAVERYRLEVTAAQWA